MLYGPDFICIGAQKAGTTWLYKNLHYHPQVVLPPLPIKEVNFFFDRKPIGSRYLWQPKTWLKLMKLMSMRSETRSYYRYLKDHQNWHIRYRNALQIKEYRELFPKYQNRLTGDISPAYAFLGEEIIEQIAQICPDTKIIYILRNPIERTWSQFRMDNINLMQELGTDELLEHIKRHLGICDHSYYTKSIPLWSKYFPKNIRIWFYDQLCEEPVKLFGEICDYLGISFYGKPKQLAKKIFKGPPVEMPRNIREYFEECFNEELKILDQHFSNKYTKSWCKRDIRPTFRQRNIQNPGLKEGRYIT